MILTGERKKVNNDFARQELFLISETNQPAEAGFFVAFGCAFRPQVQDIDIFREVTICHLALNHAKFVAFEFKEVLAVDKTVATSLPTNQQKKPPQFVDYVLPRISFTKFFSTARMGKIFREGVNAL